MFGLGGKRTKSWYDSDVTASKNTERKVASEPSFLVTRLLIATLCTGLAGAIGTMIYGRLLSPGPPDEAFPLRSYGTLFVISLPYIFAGFLFLGLPITFILKRLRLEASLAYAAAGVAAGILWGAIVLPRSDLALSAYYGLAGSLFWQQFRPRN
jgi:hypothetical protein